MPTTVTITGTGCPIPSAERAGPGVLVRRGDQAFQIDAGRATVPRLAALSVRPVDLTAVLVTHHHSDHLTGLQDLALTRWVIDAAQRAGALTIVMPAGPSETYVRAMLGPWADDLAVRSAHTGRPTDAIIDVRPFALDDGLCVVWDQDDVRILAGEVRHEPVHPAVGYRIETPEGVTAITGDTLVCDEVAVLAEGADVLVYEAMRFEPIERLPEHRRFILDYHADTRLIGRQAAELGVATLVLTHLIPEPMNAQDRQAFVDDVRGGGFEGELIVADDLDEVVLGG